MTTRIQKLTGSERWQVSYADLLTLLLGFFIVMYAVSSMESEKRQQVITALQEGFSGRDERAKPAYIFGAGFESNFFDVEIQGPWIYFSVASETFFEVGSAMLTDTAKQELEKIASIIALQSGNVEVEGHTDNQVITTDAFPNNWALSSARAVSVVSFLVSINGELKGERFKAIGFGEFSPIADNRLEEGRQKNRRVVIKVENSSLLQNMRLFEKIDVASDKHSSLRNHEGLDDGDRLLKPKAANGRAIKSEIESRLINKGISPQKNSGGGVRFSND